MSKSERLGAPGSSSLWVVRVVVKTQASLDVSLAISIPEINLLGEPSSLSKARAAPGNSLLVPQACLVTRGRRNMAKDHKGFPGSCEILSSPSWSA
jgi:hypothetical protein